MKLVLDARTRLFTLLVVGAVLFGVGVAANAQAPTIDLGDIFEEGIAGGILDDLLTRTYLGSDPTEGPRETLPSGVEIHALGMRGAKFAGYCNKYDFPQVPDPCCEGECPNLCDDPDAEPIEKEERLAVEIYFPPDFESQLSNPESALLLVFNSGPPTVNGEPNEGYLEKRRLMIDLAEAGISGMLWYQRDDYPFPPAIGEPVAPMAELFGYPGDGAIQKAGFRWLMQRDPDNLTVEDLRFDYRYAYAQRYILSTTFFGAYVSQRLHPANPFAQTWVDSLRVVYAGGSKRGGGVILGGGGDAFADGSITTAVDPRVVAIYVAGFQGFSDAPDSGWPRYQTDWDLPPGCDPCDPCESFDPDEHPWKDFVGWAWKYRNHHPSYFDAYVPARNEEHFESLLLLDIVGTHDWINPLGSHTSFWRKRNGGEVAVPRNERLGRGEGGPSTRRRQHPLWDYRVVRRINKNHGTFMIAGTLEGEDLSVSELLLRSAMIHLRHGDALPRVDLMRLEAREGRPIQAIVRVDETRPGHIPSVHETLNVHVAMSDDRDFRRCSAPIENRTPGICFDPDSDDNKDEEDRFIEVTPLDVQEFGPFRRIRFELPPERDAFLEPPITAVIIEARFEGDDPTTIADDLVVTTEVEFLND